MTVTRHVRRTQPHTRRCASCAVLHHRSSCIDLFPTHPVHSSAPTSKQHLCTQRVSHNHRLLHGIRIDNLINSTGQRIREVHRRQSMVSQSARDKRRVHDTQFRARGIPSMLLDTVLPEEILPVEAMGRCVPWEPMGSCEHHMHATFHQPGAGKTCKC